MAPVRWRRLLARAAAVAGLLALTGCGSTTTRHDFELDAATVASVAAEGSLLARDVAEGDAFDSFVRVHARELAGQAAELADTLLRLRNVSGLPAERLATIAATVADDLESLSRRPPAEAAGRIEARLDRQAALAAALERRA